MSKVDANSDDDTEIKDRRLCSNCVGDTYLRAEIEKVGELDTCNYCGKVCKTISIEDMADHIESAFESHYQRTSTDPDSYQYAMMSDPESTYDWEREGEPVVYVIAGTAEIDEAPAEDIRQVLDDRTSALDSDHIGEEDPFDEEAHYISKDVDDIEYRENWRYFEKSLKTEARFFSAAAEATLENIFEGVTDHKTHDGKAVIVEAGPGTEMPALFRARIFQSESKLEEALKRPDKDIGSPPAVAAVAGRMNARGISVFYGATDPSVAIGEVRPPVGSRAVLGRFELLRKVRLLDVNALKAVYVEGSIFDGNYTSRLERAKFLERVSDRITAPVMPDDEPLEYLVTQTIADYLATRTEPALDGILYPSAQGLDGGVNVMLFHKAALVAPIVIPEGTEITANTGHNTEDGWEEEYWVFEEVPPAEPGKAQKEKGFGPDLSALLTSPKFYGDDDLREPTLALDVKTLTVHRVTAVKFETNSFSVHRHRSEKRKNKFESDHAINPPDEF